MEDPPKKRKRRAEPEEADDDEDDDACLQAAIERHKKLLGGDGAAAKETRPGGSTKARKKSAQAADTEVAAKASTSDGVGTSAPSAPSGKKAKAKATEEDEKAKAKRAEIAERQRINEKIRQKGKMTKKEKYKAAKAAKKAEALKGKGASAVPCKALEEEALKAAGMDRLNPKAVDCFLTGLPYMATERHVQEHFAKVGPCTVSLMRDKDTGRATGKGFVTFPTAQMALKASTYSGTKLQNRWINVRLCEVRDNGRSRVNLGPVEKPEGCLSAVVMCDKSVSEASLWKFFEDCEVSGVSRMMDKSTGEFRGMAFLDFEDTSKVDLAVAKNGTTLKGLPVFVRYKSDKPGAGAAAAAGGKPDKSGRVAAHNRAPPVPPPCGKATKLDDSDDEDDAEEEGE